MVLLDNEKVEHEEEGIAKPSVGSTQLSDQGEHAAQKALATIREGHRLTGAGWLWTTWHGGGCTFMSLVGLPHPDHDAARGRHFVHAGHGVGP